MGEASQRAAKIDGDFYYQRLTASAQDEKMVGPKAVSIYSASIT